jgi:hypothetical protein
MNDIEGKAIPRVISPEERWFNEWMAGAEVLLQ